MRVVQPHAGPHPTAVMVKARNTAIAETTVLTAGEARVLARIAFRSLSPKQ